MSYILDALRKSDQLRRRSGTPTLLQVPVEVATPKQPPPLLYAAIALLLLALGIAIGWWRPWLQEERTPTAGMRTQATPELVPAGPAPEAAVPSVRQAPPPAPAAIASAPAAALAAPAPARAPSATGQAAKSAPVQEAAAPVQPKPKAVAQREVPAATHPEQKEARPARSAIAELPAVTQMKLSELPLGIQQELPPLSISVHAYSGNARDRLVGINGRLLHEGDVVAPGLKLEQITLDGMILSYKGYTFRRGVN